MRLQYIAIHSGPCCTGQSVAGLIFLVTFIGEIMKGAQLGCLQGCEPEGGDGGDKDGARGGPCGQ